MSPERVLLESCYRKDEYMNEYIFDKKKKNNKSQGQVHLTRGLYLKYRSIFGHVNIRQELSSFVFNLDKWFVTSAFAPTTSK